MPDLHASSPQAEHGAENEEGLESALEDGKEQLRAFAEARHIRPLTDRMRRGLNEAASLALDDTAGLAKLMSSNLGASYEDVEKMTLDINGGGPWAYAHDLDQAEKPAVKAWMMLNAATTIGREREMDLTPKEFMQDVDRVKGNLLEAAGDTEAFWPKAKEHVLEASKKLYRVEDGVPISEVDNGFVAMAINGYEAGVWQDADGMVFVGAKDLDESLFEKWGLKTELREDRGRKDVVFYVNDKGEALFKKVYPGFLVVVSRSLELGKAIVKARLTPEDPGAPSAEALGHVRYAPSSKAEDSGFEGLGFLRRKDEPRAPDPESESVAMERSMDRFFREMGYIKSQVIFMDALDLAKKEKESKGKPFTDKDFEKLSLKVGRKVEQKMDELRYLEGIIGPELDKLPPEVGTVMDMAGGAGDLGLMVGSKEISGGRSLKEIRIVDPFSKSAALDVFSDFIVDYLPFKDELREKLNHTNETIQEAEITADAAVVAKHACGDLTDGIIEKWSASESPLLVIMTCCQDKAADQPARYGLEQAEWKELCRASAKTNSPKDKDRDEGMRAMLRLDNARVEYLRRMGFEAELSTTDKFPKGDVIVARRKRKAA